MTPIKIIFSTVFIAICYGIVHDMITAHLCVEYFTIGHPKVIESESPVLLAIVWGTIATWWVALPMGLLIAGFNHLGKNPALAFRYVLRLVLNLIFFMFAIAILAGLAGYFLTELNVIYLVPMLGEQIDSVKHSAFLAAGWAHTSSYMSGIIGTIILCIIILIKRCKIAMNSTYNNNPNCNGERMERT